MQKINWSKIDKFYIVFLIVMSLMAVMVVFTFKVLFSSFIKAYEIDQRGKELKVDKEKLEQAYNFAFERKEIKLELK